MLPKIMLKKLDFIALIPNEQTKAHNYIAYLIQKQDKIILPLDIQKTEAVRYLKSSNSHEFVNPSTHNTVYRIFMGLNIKINNISFYKYDGENFYTYLDEESNNKNIKINVSPIDGLILSKMSNCPIYVKDEILYQTGIKLTEKVLRDALFEG